MPDLIFRTIFTLVNVFVGGLIFWLLEKDSMVFVFIVCCVLVTVNGAVLDLVEKHGKSEGRNERRF